MPDKPQISDQNLPTSRVVRPDDDNLARFIARQPIFTVDRKLFAYELLARSNPTSLIKGAGGAGGLTDVKALDDLFLTGIEAISGGSTIFINCTRQFLVNEYLMLMPRDLVVAEILENVEADDEVLAACRRMRARGYRFALDDYTESVLTEEFLQIADFVKIDVLATSFADQKRVIASCRARGIPALAEKVETNEQFEDCKHLGYQFFQGYFFRRPQMLSRRSVPANKLVYIKLLQMVHSGRCEFGKVAELLKQDLSLSYRLLRYLNSPLFRFTRTIDSIQDALLLMGEDAIRKWVSIVAVAALSDSENEELLRLPLIRAEFCELVAEELSMARKDELFLMGLLSVMDVFLSVNISEVLAELRLSDGIKKAILGESSPYSPVYELVLNYETANWERVFECARALGLAKTRLPELYTQSIVWASNVLSQP
jgi:c-di-GMP-related signal transduction protein